MEVVASLKKDMSLQSRKQLDLHNQKDNSPIKGFLGFSFRESYFLSYTQTASCGRYGSSCSGSEGRSGRHLPC